MTTISKCACQHSFQDAEYGKGNRVYNVGVKSGKAKCTVCGTSISFAIKK